MALYLPPGATDAAAGIMSAIKSIQTDLVRLKRRNPHGNSPGGQFGSPVPGDGESVAMKDATLTSEMYATHAGDATLEGGDAIEVDPTGWTGYGFPGQVIQVYRKADGTYRSVGAGATSVRGTLLGTLGEGQAQMECPETATYTQSHTITVHGYQVSEGDEIDPDSGTVYANWDERAQEWVATSGRCE